MISFFIIFAVILAIAVASLWAFFKYRPEKKKKTDSLYTDALNAMLRADKLKAITLLKNIVKQDSDHVDAYLQLGSIIRDEDPHRALKIHQTLTVRPNLDKHTQIEIYKSLAMDYEAIDDLIKSQKEAEQILKFDKSREYINKWVNTSIRGFRLDCLRNIFS